MPEQRKYSIAEIDRMRTVIRWLQPTGVAYYEADRAAAVEDQLRTHMMNGTEPEELEKALQDMFAAEKVVPHLRADGMRLVRAARYCGFAGFRLLVICHALGYRTKAYAEEPACLHFHAAAPRFVYHTFRAQSTKCVITLMFCAIRKWTAAAWKHGRGLKDGSPSTLQRKA